MPPSIEEPQADNASNGEQYKPNLRKTKMGDFMRPASRTRASSNSKTNGVGVQVEETRICVVMVGLPARGKSLIAQK
ncbi:Fructose-2,6-bisphosphatase, partial [Friedmanniomyces endolithicus]